MLRVAFGYADTATLNRRLQAGELESAAEMIDEKEAALEQAENDLEEMQETLRQRENEIVQAKATLASLEFPEEIGSLSTGASVVGPF